jgi:hypothetical protein
MAARLLYHVGTEGVTKVPSTIRIRSVSPAVSMHFETISSNYLAALIIMTTHEIIFIAAVTTIVLPVVARVRAPHSNRFRRFLRDQQQRVEGKAGRRNPAEAL